jgi:hypothetical protein
MLLFSENFISFVLLHAFIKRNPRLVKADVQGLVEGIKIFLLLQKNVNPKK